MNSDALTRRWQLLHGLLNESQRRRWAGIEAEAIGAGGVSMVAQATGLARRTVKEGLAEVRHHLQEGDLGPWFLDPALDQRNPGGGRKRSFPGLESALVSGMDQQPPGSVCRTVVFRWTCLSQRQLAARASSQSVGVSRTTIAARLADLGFWTVSEPWAPKMHRLEARALQYASIGAAVSSALDAARPVVVLQLSKSRAETGKVEREVTGEAARLLQTDRSLQTTLLGRESWDEENQGEARRVDGWSVDAPDAHTVGLAAETIRQWWRRHGHQTHESSGQLLVVANGIGAEGDALRRWRAELSRFAMEAGIDVQALYLPPGICRWSHCAHQLGAVLAVQDQRTNWSRHKVVCKAIDWTGLPEHASHELAQERRAARKLQRPQRPPPRTVSLSLAKTKTSKDKPEWGFVASLG